MTCKTCGCELTLYEAHENAGVCSSCTKIRRRRRVRPADPLFDADELGLNPEDDDARLRDV